MMKIAVQILNYAGYLIGCNVLGNWFYKFYYGLFGFIKDETYAEEHPKMYIAKLIGVMVVGILIGLAVIWYPLTKLWKWLNSKIDEFFDREKEDEEVDEFDFLD